MGLYKIRLKKKIDLDKLKQKFNEDIKNIL